MAQVEPYGGEQQGEWNRERDDDGGTDIQKKQKKDDAYQNHAFGQVVHHRVQGEMKEIAAIQHGNDLDTGRQDAVVELIHLLVNRSER